MSLRDQRFYANLFFWLLFLAVIFRYLVMFVGINITIPYFDPIMETTFRIIGNLCRAFAWMRVVADWLLAEDQMKHNGHAGCSVIALIR